MTEWKSETVTLAHPIPGVGENAPKITALTLMEPDVEALEAIWDIGFEAGKNASPKQLRHAIAALARVEPDVLKKLHPVDFEVLAEKAVPFVQASSKPSGTATSTDTTSKPSSPTSPPS